MKNLLVVEGFKGYLEKRGVPNHCMLRHIIDFREKR